MTLVRLPRGATEDDVRFVAAVVDDGAGRVLVGHRPDDEETRPGEWEFPGGKRAPDEAPDVAVRREVAEEMGLHVTILPGRVYFPLHSGGGYGILFHATPVGRDWKLRLKEHDRAGWIKLEDIEKLEPTSPDFVANAFELLEGGRDEVASQLLAALSARRQRIARRIVAAENEPLETEESLPSVAQTLGEGKTELRSWDPRLLVHDYVLKAADNISVRFVKVPEIIRIFQQIIPAAVVRDAIAYWAKEGFWKITERSSGFRGRYPQNTPTEIELPESIWIARRELEERMLTVDALRRSRGKVTDAARLLGISPRAIRYRLTKHGITKQQGGEVDFPEQLPDTGRLIRLFTKDDIIEALFRANNDVAQAAKTLGYTYNGLLKALHRYGVQRQPTPTGADPTLKIADVVQEIIHAQGNLTQAAHNLGVPVRTVYAFLHDTEAGRAVPQVTRFPHHKAYMKALRGYFRGIAEGGRYSIPKARILRALLSRAGEWAGAARDLNISLATLRRIGREWGIASLAEVTGQPQNFGGSISAEVRRRYVTYLRGLLEQEGETQGPVPATMTAPPQLKNRLDLRRVLITFLRNGGAVSMTARELGAGVSEKSLAKYLRWEQIPLRTDFPNQKSFVTALQTRAAELGVGGEPLAGRGVTRLHEFTPAQLVQTLIESGGRLTQAAARLGLKARRELTNLLRMHRVPTPQTGQAPTTYLRILQAEADRYGIPRAATDPYMAGEIPVSAEALLRALHASEGRMIDTAQALGLHRKALLKYLQRLRIPTPGKKPLGEQARAAYLRTLADRAREMGIDLR